MCVVVVKERMGEHNRLSQVESRVRNYAAARPQLVLLVVMLLLFVAMQGTAAAETTTIGGGDLVGTTGEGAVDTGP